MAATPVVVLSTSPGRRPFERCSPTQVENYQRCPRLWYDQYVLGLKSASTPAQELGTDVHSVLEAYLKTGAEPPNTTAGIIAKVGLHLLPKPGTVVVEGKVEIPGAPIPMVGVIDWIDANGASSGTPGILTVGDHKTSADKKWMKTREQLVGDVQLTSYVHYGFSLHPGMNIARAVHTYFGTKGSWSEQVSVTILRKKNDDEWAGVCETIKEMQADAVKDEAQVRQVPTACGAYGGCHLKDRCWGAGKGQVIDVSTPAPTAAVPEQFDLPTTVLLSPEQAKSELVAIKLAAAGITVIAPPETKEEKSVSNPLDDLRNSILGGSAPKASAGGSPAPGNVAAAPKTAATPPTPRLDLPGGRDGVNPPETPGSERDAGMELTAGGAKKTTRTRVAKPPSGTVAPPANGRKKLYIGCWPTKGVVCVDFGDWVRPFQEAVAKARNVPHIAAVDFGKAYADVVVEVRHHGWPADVEAFYIDNMGPSKACVEMLIQMADEVVHKL